jgi:hypothetical protein
MKKVVRLAALVALLVSLVSFGMAGAQTGVDAIDATVTYQSGFQVQNLEDAVATVVLEFYNPDGSQAVTPAPSYTINNLSSRTFFPINDAPAGFNGSLVISSDRDIRAVSNLVGSGPGNYFAATNGFQAGSTSVALPLIMCNNNGFDTFFSVQNAGTAVANITINYTPGSNGTPGLNETAAIPPGASKTFDQTAGSTTRNCGTLADGTGKFIGSASITSDQPVVAVVMQLNTTTWKVLMGYGGFTGGSPSVALPLVMANNSGFYTGIQVQNVGSVATDVTVDYSANTAGAGNPTDDTFTLQPGASQTLIQNAGQWAGVGKYIGGANITNTAAQPLVAIVNQVNPTLGTAYEGFNPATATTKISAPLIMSNNSTYYTGIQVQNVSGGNVNVTIAYGPNTAGAFDPLDETFTLAAGASKTIIQNGAPPSNGSTVNNWGTNKYIGSATITADGAVVAIVNQVSLSVAGDQFATSDAFNY